MELTGADITVIGAGIGGLAAALSLDARGARVTVLEQAEAITEVGAGLQISPNGFAVLRALGLGDDLAALSVRGQAVVLRDYQRAGEVMRLDLTRLPPEQGYFFVHRADLIDLLAGAVRARGIQIRLLQKVSAVMPGTPPQLRCQTGAEKTAKLIIGADGLHSRLRVALNGDDAPFFTGQVAWRAVVPNDIGLAPEANVVMAPGKHLVIYPLRGGAFLNIVAVQERADWTAEGWFHRDDPDNLRAAFSDVRGLGADVLNRVEDVRLWGLFRHEVAARWHGPGVAILGDAAHPTLPFLAQGANMALEDAWVLAAELGRGGADALQRYQDRRRPHTAKVIAAANGNAWRYHLRSKPVRRAAHLALGLAGRLAPGRMLGQFDWLYGVDVTRD